MKVTNSTYEKELAKEVEKNIMRADTMYQITGIMIPLYDFMLGAIESDDSADMARIYALILKATEHMKTIAEKENVKPWDGN